MSETERWITIGALINSAIFYIIVIIVFLIARRDRLNKALAAQKVFWLLIIGTVALPAYLFRETVPLIYREALWLGLSFCTWWVFWEVWLVNRTAVRAWYHKQRHCFYVWVSVRRFRVRHWLSTRWPW